LYIAVLPSESALQRLNPQSSVLGLGNSIRNEVTPEFYSLTGAHNTYAGFRSIQWHGADFSIRHNSGVALFQEFGYSPQYLQVRDYPGTFKLDGFYDSEPLRQFVLHRITGTWMVYGLAQQRLYTPEPGTERRLTGLLGFAYAPPDVDTLEYFGNAGLLHQGLIPACSQDALGLFAIFGEFFSDLREAQRMNHQPTMTHEAVLELNYMYEAARWLHGARKRRLGARASGRNRSLTDSPGHVRVLSA
jgi:hypothetical protein